MCAHEYVKQLCNKYDSRCTELSKLVRYMMIALSWKSSYVEINHRILLIKKICPIYLTINTHTHTHTHTEIHVQNKQLRIFLISIRISTFARIICSILCVSYSTQRDQTYPTEGWISRKKSRIIHLPKDIRIKIIEGIRDNINIWTKSYLNKSKFIIKIYYS